MSASDVTRRYGEGEAAVDALQGVSLDVRPGELVAVMGASGSGKSTLMHLLAALDKPTCRNDQDRRSGRGRALRPRGDVLRRRHIGFVFQFFNLLPMLSAEENVALPLSIAGEKPEPVFFEDLLGARRARPTGARTVPSELSGGQQQRVAIARALVSKPTVVFADEPTGNLDSRTGAGILELLRASAEELGQTMVMVTHDAHAAEIADRVLFLADGRIVEELPRSGAPEILAAMGRAGT